MSKSRNIADLGSNDVLETSADGITVTGEVSATDLTVTNTITGSVSDISNHDTDDLTEGTTNQYFTEARVLAALSASDGITFNSGTGEFTLTDSGVTADTYGSASEVPVLTIDANGRVTAATTTNVAGVSTFTYDSVNETLTITTADGGSFSVDVSSLASESFVNTIVSNLVDSAPTTLDTLNELAAAINDDANFAATVTTALGTKVDKIDITGATVGSSTAIPVITYNTQGQITSATETGITVGDGQFTVTAGSGLTDGGVLGTANQTGDTSVTISHADTSTQASVDNSGNTFIQDITLDDFGHITAIGSGTVTVGDATITIDAGTDLVTGGDFTTNQGTNETITLDHASITRTDTTSSQTATHSGTVTVVDGVTTSATGHVTAVNVKTVTLPAGAVPNDATITISAGTDLSTGGNFTTDQGTNETITLNHANITRTDTTSTASPAHGGTFTVVDGITSNARGHITAANVKTVTLPAQYVHPTHAGDDINLDTGALSGGTVISDLDFNITTDTSGHVTDANATYSTKNLDDRYYTETESDARFVNVTGDTITGSLTIDGDLTVGGTTTTVNAENLAISDNMVYLNDGNSTENIDLGWAGNYNDGTYAHTGFFRDASDGRFKVFDGYTPEPDAAVNIDTTHASFNLADIQAGTFYGALSGNASTASKWATARTLSLSGDASGSVSWDGSANATLSVTVANDSHTHDGRYYTESESDSRFVNVTGDTMTGDLSVPKLFTTSNGSGTNVKIGDDAWLGDINVANTLRISGAQNANNGYITFGNSSNTALGRAGTGALTWGSDNIFHDGYHPNADKWTTARTLSLTGDVTGSTSWDGSGNASITTVVANDSHTHNKLAGNSHVVRNLDTLIQSTVLDGEMHYHAYSAGSTGGVGMSDNANGVITVGQHNGGYNSQISFSSDGHLYWRESIAGGTPTAWQKIWKSGSDGSGSGLDADLLDGQHGSYYAAASHTHSYLPLSGGSVTGPVSINGGTANASTDGTLYVTATNDNDWGVIIDKNNGSSTNYGLEVRLGASNTYGIRMLGGGSEQFRVNSDYAYHYSDMRSPIFYDSNNTAYYADLASTGTSVNAAGKIRGNYFVASHSGGYTQYKGYDNNNHFIAIRGIVGGNTTSPSITGGHNTTFVEYAEANDTTGWFFKTAGDGNYTQVAKITRSYSQFEGSARAPLFYDSNNTGYYVDPASTTKLNALELDADTVTSGITGLTTAPINTTYTNVGSTNTWLPMTRQRAQYSSGYITHVVTGMYKSISGWGSGASGWSVAMGGSDSYPTQEWRLTYDGYIYNSLGYVRTAGSFRSPIFYDSDNTGYYVDPNGSSVLNTLYVKGGTDGLVVVGDTSKNGDTFDAERPTLQLRGGQYPHLTLDGSRTSANGASTNTNHGPTLSFLSNLSGGSGYRRWVMGAPSRDASAFSWGYHDNNANPHYGVGGTLGYTNYNSKMWLATGGDLQTTGSMRAPIFYDSNDTGYYVNPNDVSRVKHIETCARTANAAYHEAAIEVREVNYGGTQTDSWAYAPRIGLHWGGRVASQIALASNGRVHILNNPGDGNESLQCQDLYVQGTLYEASDARLKENVITINNALDKVLSLRGVSYNRIGSDLTEIGFIAQEVESVIPELVTTDTDDGEEIKKVSYARTVALLVEANKELNDKLESQQAQIDELKELVNQLLNK